MVRTQIQLTEEQLKYLRELARARSCSLAELIREGVDLVIARAGSPSTPELRERAKAASGKFRSGLKDLSRRHDEYLPEAFGH